MTDWTKVLALHLMAQEENMDMSDPSVQRMLDDDRAQALARIDDRAQALARIDDKAQALARIRAAKQEDNEKGD